jgi:membrane protease YdiL (CAAX protease family)
LPFYAKTGAAVLDLQEELWNTLLAFGIVGGLAANLALVSWLISRRARLLPVQRTRRGNWDGGQVLFVFAVMIFVPGMVETGLLARGFFHLVYGEDPSAPFRKHLWSSLIAFVLIIPTILVPLYLLRGTRPSDLGLTRARFLPNVTLGCLAWFPLTLGTLAVHFLVLQCMEGEEHPLAKLVKEGLAHWEWALIGVEALAAAPFLEELVFRGVLQGWLARCSRFGHIVVMAATLFVAGLPYFFADEKKEPDPAPLLFALCLVPGYVLVVFRHGPTGLLPFQRPLSPRATRSRDAAEDVVDFVNDPLKEAIREGPPPSSFSEGIQSAKSVSYDRALEGSRSRRFPLPAIYGSSILWAAFHSTVWPSPIPLFLLGLGLAWLAYRTQSLISSLTVHVLFNAVAFLVLMLQTQI